MKKVHLYKVISSVLFIIATIFFYVGYKQVKSPILLALAFHDISDDKNDLYSITEDGLIELVKKYKNNEYKALSPAQFEEELFSGQDKKNGRKYILTFDDGKKSSVETIKRLKNEFGITSTIFLILDLIGKPDYMDLSTIIDLKENYGCNIGLHGKKHIEITKILENKESLTDELKSAREILSNLTNQEVTWYSYPYGETNTACTECVKNAGLKIAFNVEGGNINNFANTFFINRIMYTKNATKNGMPNPENWAPPHTTGLGSLTVTLSILVCFFGFNWLIKAKQLEKLENKKKQNNL